MFCCMFVYDSKVRLLPYLVHLNSFQFYWTNSGVFVYSSFQLEGIQKIQVETCLSQESVFMLHKAYIQKNKSNPIQRSHKQYKQGRATFFFQCHSSYLVVFHAQPFKYTIFEKITTAQQLYFIHSTLMNTLCSVICSYSVRLFLRLLHKTFPCVF